jgi:hypothetical protein
LTIIQEDSIESAWAIKLLLLETETSTAVPDSELTSFSVADVLFEADSAWLEVEIDVPRAPKEALKAGAEAEAAAEAEAGAGAEAEAGAEFEVKSGLCLLQLMFDTASSIWPTLEYKRINL